MTELASARRAHNPEDASRRFVLPQTVFFVCKKAALAVGFSIASLARLPFARACSPNIFAFCALARAGALFGHQKQRATPPETRANERKFTSGDGSGCARARFCRRSLFCRFFASFARARRRRLRKKKRKIIEDKWAAGGGSAKARAHTATSGRRNSNRLFCEARNASIIFGC